jgi:hypothetical protein
MVTTDSDQVAVPVPDAAHLRRADLKLAAQAPASPAGLNPRRERMPAPLPEPFPDITRSTIAATVFTGVFSMGGIN